MLSVKQAARLLDVSTDFINDHITKGTIGTVALKSANGTGARKPVRILATDLDRLIDEIRPGLEPMVEDAMAR